MIVIIAQQTPDAIRGMLKRWFIEPRPNVFVGSVNRRTQQKTLEYIKRNAAEMSYLMICSDKNCQGFTIENHGFPDRQGIMHSGLWLVAEAIGSPQTP